jgi:hypothetical protein
MSIYRLISICYLDVNLLSQSPDRVGDKHILLQHLIGYTYHPLQNLR